MSWRPPMQAWIVLATDCKIVQLMFHFSPVAVLVLPKLYDSVVVCNLLLLDVRPLVNHHKCLQNCYTAVVKSLLTVTTLLQQILDRGCCAQCKWR